MACLVERNGGISPTSSRRSLQGEKSPCRACDGCAGCSALGIGSCADGRLRARVKLIMRCCVDPQLPGKYGCGRHPAAQRNVALQRECVLLHFSRQGRHGPGARRLWRGVNVIAVAGSVNATPIRAWPHICGCSWVKEATGILRRFEKEGQRNGGKLIVLQALGSCHCRGEKCCRPCPVLFPRSCYWWGFEVGCYYNNIFSCAWPHIRLDAPTSCLAPRT